MSESAQRDPEQVGRLLDERERLLAERDRLRDACDSALCILMEGSDPQLMEAGLRPKAEAEKILLKALSETPEGLEESRITRTEELNKAILDARDKALEEAAAEVEDADIDNFENCLHSGVGSMVARWIRGLKSRSKTPERKGNPMTPPKDSAEGLWQMNLRNALMSREKISRWAQENDAPWVEVPADWLRALEEALSQEPKRKESP